MKEYQTVLVYGISNTVENKVNSALNQAARLGWSLKQATYSVNASSHHVLLIFERDR